MSTTYFTCRLTRQNQGGYIYNLLGQNTRASTKLHFYFVLTHHYNIAIVDILCSASEIESRVVVQTLNFLTNICNGE